jgi:dolichyl-phosphate-mannose--protein O-mannosyl transferase
MRREFWPVLALLILVPLIVELVVYAGRLEGTFGPPWAHGTWLRAWFDRHVYMLDFHTANLAGASSPPWTMPMLVEPLPYVSEPAGRGWIGLYLVANTPIWWLGLGAVAVALVRVRQTKPAELVVAISFAATYLAWVALTRARSEMFLFYFVPSIPFLYLALGWAAHTLLASRAGRLIVGTVAAVSVAVAIYFTPVMTSAVVDRSTLERRACTARALALRPSGPCLHDDPEVEHSPRGPAAQ